MLGERTKPDAGCSGLMKIAVIDIIRNTYPNEAGGFNVEMKMVIIIERKYS